MSRGSEGNGEGVEGKPTNTFRKDCSIFIDVGDNRKFKARDIINAAVSLIGHGRVIGCVPRSGNLYELTVSDRKDLDILEDGLFIKGERYSATKSTRDTFVVSMMYLPTYISDREIEKKLLHLDVEVLSPIKRRYIEVDDERFADGTRFCKIRLPSSRKSLPFTMKLSDGENEGYYRVIHDGQCKTCSVCGSNEHLKKDCPEFICFQCKQQGHIKRHCTAERCHECFQYICECENQYEENMSLCEKCGARYCVCRFYAEPEPETENPQNIDESGENIPENNESDGNQRNAEKTPESPFTCDEIEDDAGNDNTNEHTDVECDDRNNEVDKEDDVKHRETCEDENEFVTESSDSVTETVFGDIIDFQSDNAPECNTVETPATCISEPQPMNEELSDNRKRASSPVQQQEKRTKIRGTNKKKVCNK